MNTKLNRPTNIDDILNLHLTVLKELLNQKSFEVIKMNFAKEFNDLDYLPIVEQAKLLSFDENGKLIGAYPISPIKTNYKISVEGIGTGYSMCAVDALGVAYTFNAKTTIYSIDKSTNRSIEIVIDPELENQTSQLFVSYNKISCSKDNRPNMVSAKDICPTIDFYSNIDINTDKEIDFITFKQALASAKHQFTPHALKKCIDTRLPKYIALQDEEEVPLL